MNQLASRMFTLADGEDLRFCNAFGVTSKGALEYIDLCMVCMEHARGARARAPVRDRESIILRG